MPYGAMGWSILTSEYVILLIFSCEAGTDRKAAVSIPVCPIIKHIKAVFSGDP